MLIGYVTGFSLLEIVVIQRVKKVLSQILAGPLHSLERSSSLLVGVFFKVTLSFSLYTECPLIEVVSPFHLPFSEAKDRASSQH